MSIEQRTIQNLIPIGFRSTIEQQVDRMIALTIKGREQEDKRAQDKTTNEELDIGFVLETGKKILAGSHRADEIETNQSTRNTQQNGCGHTLYRPVTIKMEREKHGITTKEIGKARGRHTGHQDR